MGGIKVSINVGLRFTVVHRSFILALIIKHLAGVIAIRFCSVAAVNAPGMLANPPTTETAGAGVGAAGVGVGAGLSSTRDAASP